MGKFFYLVLTSREQQECDSFISRYRIEDTRYLVKFYIFFGLRCWLQDYERKLLNLALTHNERNSFSKFFYLSSDKYRWVILHTQKK